LHWAEGIARLLGDFVKFDGSVESHSRSKAREVDVIELLGVQRAMPVSAFGHWLGNDHPSGVDSLPTVLEVDSSSDLLDEHRS
jgi:hypothetical protein